MAYAQPSIDWRGLLINAPWVLGAALALAVLSHARYVSMAARPERRRTRDLLDAPAHGVPLYVGFALIFLSLALSADTVLRRLASIGGLLLCAYILLAVYRAPLRRQEVSDPRDDGSDAPEEHTVEPDRAPKRKSRTDRWFVLRPGPADVPFFVIAAMAGVSLVVSALRPDSIRAIIPLIVGLALYWGLSRWDWTEDHFLWAWVGLTAMGAGIALVGLLGMIAKPSVLSPMLRQVLIRLQSHWQPLLNRLPDTFHPNVVGAALVLLLPFALTLTGSGRLPGRGKTALLRSMAGLASAPMLAVLVLSQSRGAYMGMAAGLLVINLLVLPRLLPVSLAAGAGLAALAVHLVGWSKVADEVVSSDPAYGLAWRVGVWSAAQQMVGDFAFTGVGFGCFGPVGMLLYGTDSATAPHAHNLLLQVAADLGLPGLVAFLALLGLVVCRALAARRLCLRSQQRLPALLAAACLSSLSAMVVHGLVDAASWGNKGAFVMWLVMGLGAALDRYARHACQATPAPFDPAP